MRTSTRMKATREPMTAPMTAPFEGLELATGAGVGEGSFPRAIVVVYTILELVIV
jgi:hypothetical protein